jgi:hypothetical protein
VDAPDEIADELYAAPFDEFVKRRGERARELRKEKRREEADAVKALRKPALSAWAIDQVVRSDRELVDELLAAGAALRQASGGDTLRDAAREERDAVERLAERAAEALRDSDHPVTDKTAAELRDTLHAATLDEEVRELLDRGWLVEPRQAVGFAGMAEGGRPKAGRQRTGEAERKRKAEARKALRDAEAELRDRERALEAAERAFADAERARDRASDEVDAAKGDVEKCRRELDG